MENNLAIKTVQCKCGNSFESNRYKAWCQKCCRPVFYHAKDQRRHQWNNYYMITIMATAILFVTYLFVEIIAKPLLSL